MSISAISVGNQRCEAVIPWLNQIYIIEERYSGCLLELIVKATDGFLESVDLYLPYTIQYLEDHSRALLDDNLRWFYTKDTRLISSSISNAHYNGSVVIDGHPADISDIELNSTASIRGTKVTVRFSVPIKKGESRLFRIEYDWLKTVGDNIILETAPDRYSVNFQYYFVHDARFLSLETALRIERLYTYVVFPKHAHRIENVFPNFFLLRPYDDLNEAFTSLFFGRKGLEIMNRIPVMIGMWLREDERGDSPIGPWDGIQYHCDFDLILSSSSGQPKENRSSETASRELETPISIRVLVPSASGGCEVGATPTEGELAATMDNLLQEHRVVLDERFKLLFVDGKQVESVRALPKGGASKEIEMKSTAYELFAYLMRNKDRLISTEALYREAWRHLGHSDETLPISYAQNVRNQIAVINRVLKALHLDGRINIAAERRKGYRLKADISYCVITRET